MRERFLYCPQKAGQGGFSRNRLQARCFALQGAVKPSSKSLSQVLIYLGERMARGKPEMHSISPMGLTPGVELEEVRVRHSEPTHNGCGLLCHAKPGLVSDS